MDKLSAMQAFVRVVDAGSFTKAADTMGLPKPTITRLVQSLESELKTVLLHRSTRRLTLTTEGAAYYERAVQVLEDIQDIESNLSDSKANPRGKLRIDVGSTVGQLFLIPALHEFCERYPNIQIDLGVSDRRVDLLGENVDCALRLGEVTDQWLVARRVGDIQGIVCAAPGYLKRCGVPEHPTDLESDSHRVVSYFSVSSERWKTFVLHKGKERVEVRARHTIAVNDSGAMFAAGLAGLGIVRTGAFMAAPHIAAGKLVQVLPDWMAGTAPVYIVFPPKRHLSANARVFVDWVAELFARHGLKQVNAMAEAAVIAPNLLSSGSPSQDEALRRAAGEMH